MIPAMRRLQQETCKFQASLGYIATLCLKNKSANKYNWLLSDPFYVHVKMFNCALNIVFKTNMFVVISMKTKYQTIILLIVGMCLTLIIIMSFKEIRFNLTKP
jgi:hypothetical protein